MYVTNLSASKEASSSHITSKRMTNLYTSLDGPYLSSPILGEHLIHQGQIRSEGGIRHRSDRLEIRGDVLIQGLWDRQNNDIIYTKIGDADAYTYKFDPMDKLLYWWEKMRKDKHGNHCHEQRKQFSLFILSVYGMLGREALIVVVNLSQLMAARMDRPILHMKVCINGWISIAVARSY